MYHSKRMLKKSQIVKYNLSNFYHIRPFLTSKTAKVYMHAMIFSCINYCFTTWTHTTETVLKPIKSLFKKIVKILDRKPMHFHYCIILKKFNILDLDSYQIFMDVCLILLMYVVHKGYEVSDVVLTETYV